MGLQCSRPVRLHSLAHIGSARTARVIDGTVCEKSAKSLSAHRRVAVAGIAQCAIHLKHKAAARLKFTQPAARTQRLQQARPDFSGQGMRGDARRRRRRRRAPGVTHLTFAATDDIASFLRFFLLDTAVPMLAWKRRRRGNSSFQKTRRDGEMRQ